MKVTFVEHAHCNNPVHIKCANCTHTQMPLGSEQNAETCCGNILHQKLLCAY